MTGMKPCVHAFQKPNGDGAWRCAHCGIAWREWTRGFGSNVQPKTVRDR